QWRWTANTRVSSASTTSVRLDITASLYRLHRSIWISERECSAMNPYGSANICPVIQESGRGFRKVNTAVRAIVAIVLPAKHAVPPTCIMQAIIAVEWHPVFNKNVVIVADGIAVEVTVGLFCLN